MSDTLHFCVKATLLALCLLLMCFSSASHATKKINFYYEEQELKPFYMGADSAMPDSKPGIFIEILQQVDQNLEDISIQFHRRPWKRCLHNLKSNVADAIIGSYKKEREEIGVYPQKNQLIDKTMAFSNAKYCLFTRPESPLYWTGKVFRNSTDKPVAVPQGYSIISLLTSQKLPFVTTNSTIAALDLLVKDRAEGTVTFCESGKRLLQQKYPQQRNIYAQLPALQDRNAYLIFSKQFYDNNASLAKRIWQEVSNVRSQHYGQLLQRYDN